VLLIFLSVMMGKSRRDDKRHRPRGGLQRWHDVAAQPAIGLGFIPHNGFFANLPRIHRAMC
jgi:hypothetical protein